MNRFKVATLFLLFFACLGLMSNSGGRAAVAGQAATGAPMSGSCGNAGCHAAGNFDPTMDIEARDMNGDLVTSYSIGQTYKISVTINAGTGTPGAYGFQIQGVDEDLEELSQWSNPTGNAQVVSLGSKFYVEHNSPSATNTFEVEWQPTADANSDVTFYAAGVAVNGNGSPGQDGTATSSLTLEQITSSTKNYATELELNLSPNPVYNILTVELNGEYQTIEIYDLVGKKVIETLNKQIDMSHVIAGTYIVKVKLPEGQIATSKIIKL